MPRYYIAYGSNMSLKQMAIRCPTAKLVGKAVLKDWQLVFKVFADIEKRSGNYVPILLWDITPEDESSLDIYEGYPSFYKKVNIKVTFDALDENLVPTGEKKDVTAMAYVMRDRVTRILPSRGYLETIAKAYQIFGFNMGVLAEALKEAHK